MAVDGRVYAGLRLSSVWSSAAGYMTARVSTPQTELPGLLKQLLNRAVSIRVWRLASENLPHSVLSRVVKVLQFDVEQKKIAAGCTEVVDTQQGFFTAMDRIYLNSGLTPTGPP